MTVAEADTADAPSFIFWPAELVLDVALNPEDAKRTRVATGLVVTVAAMVDALLRTRRAAGETDAAAAIVRSPSLARTQLTATEDVPGPKLAPSSRSAVEYAA